MKKYYTPSIEEFYVGFCFEFQLTRSSSGNWYKGVVKEPRNVSGVATKVRDGKVRVKHLDREDIESLGWEIGKLPYQFFMPLYILIVLPHGEYSITAQRYDECIFRGKLKNKSELSVLMEQLGI